MRKFCRSLHPSYFSRWLQIFLDVVRTISLAQPVYNERSRPSVTSAALNVCSAVDLAPNDTICVFERTGVPRMYYATAL